MTDGSKKRKRTPEELLEAIERMGPEDEARRIGRLSEAELDEEIRAGGGDPEGIAARTQALVERLAGQRERADAPPMRLAAGMPRRQAFLAILAEAARDPRQKALLDAELGAKKLEDLADDDLERLVRLVRGR